MKSTAQAGIFALDHSDLNEFLFADVGTERNGMTLSVLSLLARIGGDLDDPVFDDVRVHDAAAATVVPAGAGDDLLVG